MTDPVGRNVDSHLGSWTYTTWSPAHLRPFVQEFGIFEGETRMPRERVFPDGSMDLILQLENRYRPGDDPAAEAFPIACLNGVMETPQLIESVPGRARVLSMKIRPSACVPLLGGIAPDIAGTNVDLEDIVGPSARMLIDRCQEARTAEETLRVAAAWVSARVRRDRPDPVVDWLSSRIVDARGAVSIGRLQEVAGGSASRLSRRFREHVGVTPKRFARIHRFRFVLDALHRAPRPLSTLALDAGYYDQAHMNGEFRSLARMTPREYLSATRYPGSASIVDGSGWE